MQTPDQLLYETLRSDEGKIIDEVECLLSQLNEKLGELPGGYKSLAAQALEEIDLFQKTTLRELKQVFE